MNKNIELEEEKNTILYVYERISESSNFFSQSKPLSLTRSYTITDVIVEDITPTKNELQTIPTNRQSRIS